MSLLGGAFAEGVCLLYDRFMNTRSQNILISPFELEGLALSPAQIENAYETTVAKTYTDILAKQFEIQGFVPRVKTIDGLGVKAAMAMEFSLSSSQASGKEFRRLLI